MDTETVDNGILDHLYTEIVNVDNPSDLIIAHFLGVDHCGHKFNVRHDEMRRKLHQMDTVLSNLIDLITDQDVLLVIGDHGMTDSGGHGGETDDEVHTVLLSYSKRLKNVRSTLFNETIDQIDITPTLSALLNVPIPFGNLGTVILDLMNPQIRTEFLNENTRQIKEFVKYFVSSTQPSVHMRFKQLIDDNELTNLQFNRLILKEFRLIWTRFNLTLMSSGIVIVFLGLIRSTNTNSCLFIDLLAGLGIVGICLGSSPKISFNSAEQVCSDSSNLLYYWILK
ncbi:hypothetical protein ACOME3_006205 [Neoechinorhynchus agilis]